MGVFLSTAFIVALRLSTKGSKAAPKLAKFKTREEEADFLPPLFSLRLPLQPAADLILYLSISQCGIHAISNKNNHFRRSQ